MEDPASVDGGSAARGTDRADGAIDDPVGARTGAGPDGPRPGPEVGDAIARRVAAVGIGLVVLFLCANAATTTCMCGMVVAGAVPPALLALAVSIAASRALPDVLLLRVTNVVAGVTLGWIMVQLALHAH